MVVYVYSRGRANGIRVIINNLVESFRRQGVTVQEVNSLDACPKDAIVIPYGVLESWQAFRLGYTPQLALLVDAISLGYKNKVKFYFKNRYIFQYDFFYSIYGYLRYSRMERRVINAYENIMLVSQTDIDYLKIKNSKVSYWCVPNGANPVESVSPKKVHSKFRVGILSSFMSKQSYEENNWFFKRYLKKYLASHPEVEFVVAGRGKYIYNIDGQESVRIMGEVDDMDVFFSSIDVFLSLNPKGCGILNRVLDAVAYRTAVVGVEGSFSGFLDSDHCFLSFNDYNSFCLAIDSIKSQVSRSRLTDLASINITENHNWIKNYDSFVCKIMPRLFINPIRSRSVK